MMNNKELELRLQNTEQALALALKRIEELSGKPTTDKKPPLKDFVDVNVYNDLFSYSVDGVVSGRKMHDNFSALYRRVEIPAGLRLHKEGYSHISPLPLQDLKCSEYDRFGKLIADICNLIYEYKHEEEKDEKI